MEDLEQQLRDGKEYHISNGSDVWSLYYDRLGVFVIREGEDRVTDGFPLFHDAIVSLLLTIGEVKLSKEEDGRIRKIDYDLEAYLKYNKDIYTIEDIANVHAEVPGHNDEDDWYWVIELKDGSFALTNASCGYTGWDCQSGGSSERAETALAAALLAPAREESTGRHIRANLIAQLDGAQPFGLEVVRNHE